jgi:all-trans-retinol 13,14-reductase
MTPVEERFDAVVIGSGIGGLAAGALYARRGRRVLVLEKNPSIGGAASVYRVGELTIEASLHELDGLDEGDTKTPWFEQFGLLDSIEFVDVGDLYELRSPLLDKSFVMPHGVEPACAALAERFPRHAPAVRDYFARLVTIREGAFNAPSMFREHKSLSEVYQELFGDDEAIKLALAAQLPYYGDDPDTISFPFFAFAQASYHVGGGHYPRGGSKTLATQLEGLIREGGGEIQTGRRATRILCADARAVGVEHVDASDGASPMRVEAPVVFGNAAPPLLAAMLPEDQRTRFLGAYSDRSPSTSLWTISLGFAQRPREFGVRAWSTIVCPSWSRSLRDYRLHAPLLADGPGDKIPAYFFVDYSHVDVGLTPNTPYLGTLCGLDRIENWRGFEQAQYDDRRARWIETLVADLDREFPGLGGAVVQSDMTTARSIESYLGTPGGAVYGFAPEPGKAGFVRPRTPIAGLLLASSYTGFGGYTGAFMGGISAAGRALRTLVQRAEPPQRPASQESS